MMERLDMAKAVTSLIMGSHDNIYPVITRRDIVGSNPTSATKLTSLQDFLRAYKQANPSLGRFDLALHFPRKA